MKKWRIRQVNKNRSLRNVLQRAHLRVALIAVSLVGVAMIAVGVLALRAHATHNLQLIARSMSYMVEAAVVFKDEDAAAQALMHIASLESVASAVVRDASGRSFATWMRSEESGLGGFQRDVEAWLLPPPVTVGVTHNGRLVGAVEVAGGGGSLLSFVLRALIGILLCLAASALAASYFSRRLVTRITSPLRHLADVAHAVRRDRVFDIRVRPTRIAELNELGDDFNALLDELEAWQNHWQKENRTLAYRAAHDSLTGLCNRADFESRLDRMICESEAAGDQLAVLYVDVDRFKSVNDQYGHAMGDEVLKVLATRLRAQVREDDLVGRLGGDEFAVLLAPPQSAADARRIAQDIDAAMRLPIALQHGGELRTSVSVGVAMFPDHASTLTSLIDSADAAMYAVKGKRKADEPMTGAALRAVKGSAAVG